MHVLGSLIMRNVWAAGFFAGIFAVLALRLPPFVILSGSLVAMFALRRGWPQGLAVAAIAGLIVGAGWWWLGLRPGLAFPLAFAVWPPLLVMSETLRRTESPGLALLEAGVVMLAFVAIMHAVTGDVVAFWHDWLKQAVAAVSGATVKGFEENDTIRLFNGFMAFLYGLSLMLALLLGRWLQSIVFHPGGFAAEFRRSSLPRWLLPLLIVIVWGAGLVDQVLMADTFMAAILLYFFQGLAVIHGVLAVKNIPMGWAIPAYLLVVYFPPQGIAALALLGALDTFVRFRVQRGQR